LPLFIGVTVTLFILLRSEQQQVDFERVSDLARDLYARSSG